MEDKIFADCRFFSGEKPCSFHKEQGVKCSDCEYYSPVGERILIIKMGAMGDVLRTTCILTGLKEKHPDSYVTWVVEKGSGDLLHNIESIDRIMEFSLETVVMLQAEKFDLVLSLDSSVLSASIAERMNGDEKIGFGLSKGGKVSPFSPEAEEWFRMGVFDDVKRKNKRTYQEVIFEIVGISTKDHEIIVNLTDEEKKFAKVFSKENGMDNCSSPVIGLNTGAGGRWLLKKWTREGYLELIRKLHEKIGARILLFGAGGEKERNQWLVEKSTCSVIDTGSENSLREFFALLDLCNIVVAGDTLAVHAALGLQKEVVVLFGPTSPYEIELYGRGERVIAPVDCICCYRENCDRKPSCMDLITVKSVSDAVLRLLRR